MWKHNIIIIPLFDAHAPHGKGGETLTVTYFESESRCNVIVQCILHVFTEERSGDYLGQ